MNRTTLARRYAPLLAVLAVQLLVIAVVPSKAPRVVSAVADTVPGVSSTETTTPLTGGAGDTSTTLAGGVVGRVGGTTRTTVRGGGTATTIVNGRVVAAGDTSHCVNGRQYDPAIWEWAPPCRGRFVGDNGGKTTEHGVSRDTIRVEVFRGNYGQAVQAILEQQGSWPSDADFVAFMQAAQDFINKNYDLAGRRVAFKYHQMQNGTGGQGPPDDARLRVEVRLIQAKDDPFAAIWNNAVSSATYDEFSQLGIVNLGGYGFRDSFNVQHRPYHWDVEMGGTQLVAHVANWWCQRMNGGRADYAGAPNVPTDDLRGLTRVLGVVSTDDPENKEAISLLDQRLAATCGAHIAHTYFYSQDVTTAAAQVQASVQSMRSSPTATSIMCFCDQVAPAFLYNGFEQQDYRPENLIPATGFMDTDEVGQTYDHTLPPANPSAGSDRQFENAFGLAQVHKRQNTRTGDSASRMWRATGHAGPLPFDASRDWEYYMMLAELLLAGSVPALTPANIEAGAFRVPPIAPGGNANEYTNQRSLGPGDYTWNDNLREVYWSNAKTAEENGRPGAYLSLNAGRWFTDQFPSGLISLPPKTR